MLKRLTQHGLHWALLTSAKENTGKTNNGALKLLDLVKKRIKFETEAEDVKVPMEVEPDQEVQVLGFQAYSRERTRERYYMIFVWEISQGRITGYDLTFSAGRAGRYCYVRQVDPGLGREDQKRMENSLSIKGAKLFNMLPPFLRNFDGDINIFTSNLDSFISDIPDNPKCPYRECKDEDNSLLQLIPKHKKIE